MSTKVRVEQGGLKRVNLCYQLYAVVFEALSVATARLQ